MTPDIAQILASGLLASGSGAGCGPRRMRTTPSVARGQILRPDDVLSALRDDIERVRTDSAWCFNNGWWPKGANPDRVVGVNTQDVFGRDETKEIPEHIRRDIGVGCGRSRRAFQDTAYLVTFLDLQLVATLRRLGQDVQPPFAAISRRSTLEERYRALACADWRLTLIGELWDEAPRRWQSKARKSLADPKISPPSARSAADRAVRLLSQALSEGSTQGIATAEALCEVCGIRPRGERCGKRCETCQSWRTRNRGVDRPRSLDTAELAGPLAAAARRRLRGDGYGAA